MFRGLGSVWVLGGLLCALGTPAQANNIFSNVPAAEWPVGGETISIEPFVGYLRGTSTENVYTAASPKNKVSQLEWNLDAVTVGGRVAVRPIDGLTVRGRFWAAVASGADMTDYDWLGGYQGKSSWTDKSTHPDTRVPKAWQGDISASVVLLDGEDVAVTGIAGYRHYNVKYRANGGSYIYSVNAFRDAVGNFTPGRLGIAYEQWWDTPYFGFGVHYRGDDLSVSTEIFGSPFTYSRDKDLHALRSTLFKETFEPFGMFGANLAVEYRLSSMWSVAGRFEYQRYMEAKGSTKIYDATTGLAVTLPKPSAGAEADTMHVTLGVKAKL